MKQNIINIKGIDKILLMRRLWENSYPAIALIQTNKIYELDEVMLADSITQYVGYLCGRPIKIDISSDMVDCKAYDELNGLMSFFDIVQEIIRF